MEAKWGLAAGSVIEGDDERSKDGEQVPPGSRWEVLKSYNQLSVGLRGWTRTRRDIEDGEYQPCEVWKDPHRTHGNRRAEVGIAFYAKEG